MQETTQRIIKLLGLLLLALKKTSSAGRNIGQ